MEPNKLKFDVEVIKKMREEVEKASNTLSTSKKRALELIAGLEQDWNTDAGKKAMENVNTDWTSDVDKYIVTLDKLAEILSTAETEYTKIENEANNISFPDYDV